MNNFTYIVPKTLDEAIALRTTHGDCAEYIAGGTDLLVKIKEKRIAPDFLISLGRVLCLKKLYKDEATGELHIGSLTTHRMLEKSDLIRNDYPILHDAVCEIGSTQIRNVATIGGNLVNAVPSADGAIPLIAMDANIKYIGNDGKKFSNLIDFFKGPGKNILKPDEILTEIILPKLLPNTGSAYFKLGRRSAMELPILGVGVLLSMDENFAICRKARIALGVAAPTPMRATKAEALLEGREINEKRLEEAGRIASEESKARDSFRGAAWHRKEMIKTLVKRMGLLSLERARKRRFQ